MAENDGSQNWKLAGILAYQYFFDQLENILPFFQEKCAAVAIEDSFIGHISDTFNVLVQKTEERDILVHTTLEEQRCCQLATRELDCAQSRSNTNVLALHQTPLVELTVLPRSPSWI